MSSMQITIIHYIECANILSLVYFITCIDHYCVAVASNMTKVKTQSGVRLRYAFFLQRSRGDNSIASEV